MKLPVWPVDTGDNDVGEEDGNSNRVEEMWEDADDRVFS